MTDVTEKSKAKSLRGFANCRVLQIGVGNFAECVQWGPVSCSHSFQIGLSVLCLHPQVDKLIENTRKSLRAEKHSLES